MGTRGIPAAYGGFETFAEELGAGLAARQHDVTVYCRRSIFANAPALSAHRGVNLRYVPTIMNKYLETPLHSLFSFFTLVRFRFDVILLCNAANSPFAWIVRLFRIPLAINVDGVERMRKKWNIAGRLWYRLGEKCSCWFASKVVADARVIAQYYRERYGIESETIAYGANARRVSEGQTLKAFNLAKGRYILYVSRLEPENNALVVIKAFNKLAAKGLRLVIVGDAPYAHEYKSLLRAEAGPDVVFTGFQFGSAYHELQSNCLLYVQATEVGGTHPALIEAMAYSNCVVANSTPENLEVLQDCGEFYNRNDEEDLARVLKRLISSPEEIASLGRKAEKRAKTCYSWPAVVEQYEKLFFALAD
jgi:glycosyltransferase involved in cell wall biosynthesis